MTLGRREHDLLRFAGRLQITFQHLVARLKLDPPVDGAKQVSGDIVGIDGDIVSIASPKGNRDIPYSNIVSAKLLLTDKLINATAPLSTEGADTIRTEG